MWPLCLIIRVQFPSMAVWIKENETQGIDRIRHYYVSLMQHRLVKTHKRACSTAREGRIGKDD